MSDIEKRRNNIFEVLDELIFHLNTTKSMFTFLIVTSFILAPLALIVAAVITVHPGFLALLMRRLPSIGLMIIIFIGITVILASVWLYIGLMERSFFSEWNKRFSRFISLKERIDRELEDRMSREEKTKGDQKDKHDEE